MIASNIICRGASRFLNTIYCQDISVSGTATLSSLSLSGNLSVTGTSTLTGHVSIGGYNNTSYGLSTNSAIVNDWIRTVGNTGWYNQTWGGGWYMYDNYIRSYNKAVIMGHTLYFGNTNRYINTSGDAVLNSISNATNITTNNLSVANNLHATHFDLQSVAQLGGSFYVSPTIKFPNSGTKLAVSKSSTQLTLTIKDSSISTSTMAGIVWTANSAVKVSGTINGVVTGTMDGTIDSITNGSQMVVKVSGGNWNSVSATSTDLTSSQFSDLTVMVYQRKQDNNDYRVGIWMNCYDLVNSSSTIRVYGGTSSTPNVTIGNLTGSTFNGETISGNNNWGILTTMGYFEGAIVSTEGQIGGWTIGDTKLYHNTNSITSTDAGLYLGTDGIRNYSSGTQYVNITSGKITALGVDVSGKITATSGAIGGFDITSTAIKTKDVAVTSNADNSISLSSADFTRTINSTSRAGLRFAIGDKFGVTGDGAIYASSATISGAITATSLTLGTGVTIAQSQVDGLTTALNGKASTSSVTDAAKTATNFITADGTNGIKIHKTSNTTDYSQITTDYVQIISDGTHIYKGSNDVAFFGDTARIGRIANGIVRTQIDSDSFDVIKRASNTDTVLATFGETATIGNMSTRGVSIDANGFKFNNSGEQNFFIGVNNRSGDTITSATATVTKSSTTKTIDNIVYYRVASIASGQTVISVVGHFVSATENGEELMFAAVEDNVKSWAVDSGYLWVEDGYSTYSSFEESITYTYVASNTSNLPYMVLGISAYDNNNIPGIISFVQGYKNKATGSFSTALGASTIASGKGSFSCGSGTKANGDWSFACGSNTTALLLGSFACGEDTNASSYYSFAQGYRSEAAGKWSHAEGYRSKSSGDYSHAEAESTSIGQYSHSEGHGCLAVGNYSHAEGHATKTYGAYSHASGLGTVTTEPYQLVIGKYNRATVSGDFPNYTYSGVDNCPFIIGKGTGNATAHRSNAFTVDWSGNVVASGSVLAAGATLTGALSGTSATLSSTLSAAGATLTGALSGTSASFTGDVLANKLIGASATLTGALIGTSATFSGNVTANKCIGTQNILWNGANWGGGLYLGSDQYADLSESVTSQANGIILAWSSYNPSTYEVQNYYWNFTFIPKYQIANFGGQGITCTLFGANFAQNATKYVYISDTRVTGHANNTSTGTNNGVTYANNRFVLRYIIGV